MLLADIERAIQTTQTRDSSPDDSRKELEILTKQWQRLSSRLESLLSRSRKGDQLWLYRTGVRDRRGGKEGFALVRNGRVVEHMGVIIFD